MSTRNPRATSAKAMPAFLFFIAALAVPASAQIRQYQPGAYPAPKHPQFKNYVVADLMPAARMLVRKPQNRQPLEPGYGIQPGMRVLIVVDKNFSTTVLEAIDKAIEELGGKVDLVRTHAPQAPAAEGNFGWHEINFFSGFIRPGSTGDRFAVPKSLVAAGEASGQGKYDLLLNGSGGPIPASSFGWEYIPWDSPDKFIYSQAGFPYELQKAIDDKAWDYVIRNRKSHATDPEGTDLTWNWRPNFVGLLREEWPTYNMVLAGHLSPFPLFLSPKEADANGTIAGTINHVGTFPFLKLTIQQNGIAKVEGGSKYGQMWAEMLEKCKGVSFPGFPAPGCGWLEESAIGTDVWRARSLSSDTQLWQFSWERGRAGVIHWGLGVSRNTGELPAVEKWYQTHENPIGGGHFHIHTYFTSLEFTLDDGKVVKLLDKGHMTLLDDPAIRQVAAKYGNPDELLSEKWVPTVPGVNAPGDYLKDYGADPMKVIAAELRQWRQAIGAAASARPAQNPAVLARK